MWTGLLLGNTNLLLLLFSDIFRGQTTLMNYSGISRVATPRSSPKNLFYFPIDNYKMKQQSGEVKMPEVLSTIDYDEENLNKKKYR